MKNQECYVLGESRVLISPEHIVTEGQGTLDGVLRTFERSVNTEAYFGKIPMISFLVSEIEKIKKVFQKKLNMVLEDSDRKQITSHVEKIENMMATHFNVESVTIEITEGFDVGCIPVSFGKIDLKPYENLGRKEALDEFSKIIVDNSGLRYKNKENKHIIISVGYLIFSNSEMKAEYISAMLIHEIGHSFFQYSTKCSIGTQRLLEKLSVLQNVSMRIFSLVNLFRSQFAKNGDKIKKAIDFFKDDTITPSWAKQPGNMDGVNAGWKGLGGFFVNFIFIFAGIIKTINRFWKFITTDKSQMSGDIRKTRDSLLAGTYIIEKDDDFVLVFTTFLWQVFDIFFDILLMSASIPAYMMQVFVGSFLTLGVHVNRISEYNADAISAAYGLGPETAKALIMMRKVTGKEAYEKDGMLRIVRKIPVLRIILQMPFLTLNAIVASTGGYPSERARIRKLYSDIQKELKTTTLSPELRKCAMEELAKLESIYTEYIDPKKNTETENHARSFMYFIFRFVISLKKMGVDVTKDTPPKSGFTRIAFMSTLRKSKDINETLKIGPSEEAVIQETIEDSIIDDLSFNNGSMIPDDYEFEWKAQFEDSYYDSLTDCLNMEAYFGKLPIVEKSIEIIAEIRDIFPKEGGKLKDSDKKKLKDLLVKWSSMICDHFNVEETYISLDKIYNASAYPLTVGNSAEFNAAKVNTIIEDSNGFHFQTKDHMYLVMCLGIPLILDIKLSNETLVGVIFHEIGHSFQQYEVQSLHAQRSLSVYGSIVGCMKSFIESFCTLDWGTSLGILFYFPIGLLTKFGLAKSRQKYADEDQAETDKYLDAVNIKKDKDGKNIISFDGYVRQVQDGFAELIRLISQLMLILVSVVPLPGLSPILMTFIADPLYLVDLIFRGSFYNTAKKNEYFADSFAAKYGLGADLAAFNYHAYELSSESIVEIPLLKAIHQLNWIGFIGLLGVLEAHPSDRKRILAMRNRIESEILKNPDMPKKLKEDAQKQIAEIDALYNKLTDVSENLKHGRQGRAILFAVLGAFFKLKSKASSVAELAAPIVVSKMKVAQAYISTLKDNPALASNIGSSVRDIEKYLMDNKLLVEDEFDDYLF